MMPSPITVEIAEVLWFAVFVPGGIQMTPYITLNPKYYTGPLLKVIAFQIRQGIWVNSPLASPLISVISVPLLTPLLDPSNLRPVDDWGPYVVGE